MITNPGNRALTGPALLAVALALIGGGCTPTVRVEAPREPIEINLNVKIEQEVRVKLDRDVSQLLENNPELF